MRERNSLGVYEGMSRNSPILNKVELMDGISQGPMRFAIDEKSVRGFDEWNILKKKYRLIKVMKLIWL